MNIQKIRITEIEGSPYQPRHAMPQAELNELAASIEESGLLSPVLLRPVKKGNIKYQVVAGHRRIAACKALGFDAIESIVRPMSDLEAARATGIENIQREDLTGYEEYQLLLNLARLYEAENKERPSQTALAKLMGKHVNWVRNRYQVADYKPDVLALVKKHKNVISSTALINKIADKDQRAELIKLVDNGASFNDVKSAIDSAETSKAITSAKAPDKPVQGAISRGKPVTGASASEAKKEAVQALKLSQVYLSNAAGWFNKIPAPAREKEIVPLLKNIAAQAKALQ
jgi:ParB family chromosome partitioning protein